jgi:hypothetical protein
MAAATKSGHGLLNFCENICCDSRRDSTVVVQHC